MRTAMCPNAPTSPPKTRVPTLAHHWRLVVCMALSGSLAVPFWHALFPHTFWFMKLWSGFATGMAAGVVLGIFWQLNARTRFPIPSGRFVLTATLALTPFVLVALLVFAPALAAQERERARFRAMALADVSLISVRIADQPPIKVTDTDAIASFIDHTKSAELFYPSHEGSPLTFELTIHRRDGTLLVYEGRIPERHTDDFSIGFQAASVGSQMIIPNGRRWLSSISSNAVNRSHSTH